MTERYGERYEGTWSDPRLSITVGRRIDAPSVTHSHNSEHLLIRYMGRERRVPMTAVARFSALPPAMLIATYRSESFIMAHFADQADEYAIRNFSPAVLSDYYAAVRS